MPRELGTFNGNINMMKLLLPFLLVLFLFASCKNKDEKKESPKTGSTVATEIKEDKEAAITATGGAITGRWKPVEFMIKDMSEEEKKTMMADVVLEFKADGIFNAYNKAQKQEGAYNYKDNKLEITSNGSTKTDRFTISWNGSDMLMINEEGTVKLARQ